eukprot:2224295-Prymnesium_polylepis.1
MASPSGKADLLQRLGDEDFDTASFVRDALERDTSSVLASLNAKTSELSAELSGEMVAKRETLLANVHDVHALETKLLRNTERVEALAQAVRRARSQCSR